MSSRQNRADRSVLGPEDFMDEEVGVQNFNYQCVVGFCNTFSLPRKLCTISSLFIRLYLLGIWTTVPCTSMDLLDWSSV